MLVLHVGPHKTATTYLQSNFRRQRASLRRQGWLYPVIGVRTALAHHEVVEQADDVVAGKGPVFASLSASAREASRKNLNVLLSAEGFRRWRPKQVRALGEIFGSAPMRMVYVLRDPMTVVRSMWAQSVKLGATDSLPDFLANHVRKGERSRLLNPLKDLEPHLERDRVDFTILLYDEIERQGLDIYSTFAREALGLDDAKPVSAAANVRQPIELTEFIRLLSIAGYESLPHRFDVGDAVRLLFSPEQRAEIVATIRDRGAEARRTIAVSRDTPYYVELEQALKAQAGRHFRPLPKHDRLFRAETEDWACYDAEALMRVPEIAAMVKRASRSMGPAGLRMALMNGGLMAVMAGRRLRNLVAARSG